MDSVVNWYFYTPRLVQLLHSIGGVSLCTKYQLIQKLTISKSAENKNPWHVQSLRGTPYHTHSSKAREHFERGSRWIVRARGWGGLEGSNVFWIWQDQCTHNLSEAVVVCTRPAQDQASQHSSTADLGLTTPHPYLRSYWQLMDSKVGQLHSNGCFYMFKYTGSTN